MINPPTRRRQWIRALPLAAALALLVPAPIRAAPTCTVSTVAPLAFGVYDPLAAAALDVTSTITYSCPPGLVARVDIDAGSSGTFTSRTMRSGADVLRYNLYLDPQRTQIWGDGSGGSSPGPGQTVRDGLTWTAYVFGRIPPLQDVAIGSYRDSIRVTINF